MWPSAGEAFQVVARWARAGDVSGRCPVVIAQAGGRTWMGTVDEALARLEKGATEEVADG